MLVHARNDVTGRPDARELRLSGKIGAERLAVRRLDLRVVDKTRECPSGRAVATGGRRPFDVRCLAAGLHNLVGK